MSDKKLLIPFLISGVLSLAACTEEQNEKLRLANPASVNCKEKGGITKIMTRPDGGQYGICLFDGNRQCEEWALMRGNCPVGGVKVTGYTNSAATYCAITGGKVMNNESKCMLPSGTICEVDAFYRGICPEESLKD